MAIQRLNFGGASNFQDNITQAGQVLTQTSKRLQDQEERRRRAAREAKSDKWAQEDRDKALAQEKALTDYNKGLLDPGASAYDNRTLSNVNTLIADEYAKRAALGQGFTPEEESQLNLLYSDPRAVPQLDPTKLNRVAIEQGLEQGIAPKDIATTVSLLKAAAPEQKELSFAEKELYKANLRDRNKLNELGYKVDLGISGKGTGGRQGTGTSKKGKGGIKFKASAFDTDTIDLLPGVATEAQKAQDFITNRLKDPSNTFTKAQIEDAVMRSVGSDKEFDDDLAVDILANTPRIDPKASTSSGGVGRSGTVGVGGSVLPSLGTAATDPDVVATELFKEYLGRPTTTVAPVTPTPTPTVTSEEINLTDVPSANPLSDSLPIKGEPKAGKYLDGTKVSDAIDIRVNDIKELNDSGYLANQDIVLINPDDGETRAYTKGQVPDNLKSSIISPTDYIKKYSKKATTEKKLLASPPDKRIEETLDKGDYTEDTGSILGDIYNSDRNVSNIVQSGARAVSGFFGGDTTPNLLSKTKSEISKVLRKGGVNTLKEMEKAIEASNNPDEKAAIQAVYHDKAMKSSEAYRSAYRDKELMSALEVAGSTLIDAVALGSLPFLNKIRKAKKNKTAYDKMLREAEATTQNSKQVENLRNIHRAYIDKLQGTGRFQ